MIVIANPIYDVVFKYMMEDERVARILLSALLQKEIVSLEMRRHEYTDMQQSRISLFRIDFSACVREQDGSERLILIELQKTWLTTETLRFRQYLGTQYLNQENIKSRDSDHPGYGYPIVSIYILGHKLGDLQEPVVYIRRRYLDYDSRPITNGVPDPFIESLTHDSIIVQIPFLKGRTRNRLERLLNVFDQAYCMKGNDHLLEIDDEQMNADGQYLVARLVKAAATPDVRRAMDVEDEILSEIEARDTTIMLKNKEIEERDKQLEEQDRILQEKDKAIEKQDRILQEKDKAIEKQDKILQEKDKAIEKQDKILQEQEKAMEEKDRELDQLLANSIHALSVAGLSAAQIATHLSITVEKVNGMLEQRK